MAATHKIWLLRLVLPIRFGRTISALITFVGLFAIFRLGAMEHPDIKTPLIFFSGIIAYSIAVFHFITEKCQEALLALRPVLNLEADAFAEQQALLGRSSNAQLMLWTLGGLAAGTIHLIILNGSWSTVFQKFFAGTAIITSHVGTLMVWLVITTMVAFLIKYAMQFARLGRESAKIDLLNSRPLVPFSRVAIISSLSMIGALALFPLMYLDQSMNVESVLPGLIGIGIPLLVMFTIPIWPVHRRLAAAKEEVLTALNQRISQARDETPLHALNEQQLQRLNPLLQYRREILDAPVWPFDAGSVTRLVLYLIIVPLTWAGAALIEMLMEHFL